LGLSEGIEDPSFDGVDGIDILKYEFKNKFGELVLVVGRETGGKESCGSGMSTVMEKKLDAGRVDGREKRS
jgi:hypothetical protein